jgi:hypothetical protein
MSRLPRAGALSKHASTSGADAGDAQTADAMTGDAAMLADAGTGADTDVDPIPSVDAHGKRLRRVVDVRRRRHRRQDASH